MKRGAERLSDEARSQVCHYVMSQRLVSEAFINRGGQADLYYTLFGWMLCHALGIRSDGTRRSAYLQTFGPQRLDHLHQTVFELCSMLHRLLSLPGYTPDSVLKLLADDGPLRSFFETYQRHGSGGGTNAWAARLVATEETDSTLVGRLLDMQHESGGFLAHEGSAMPDMLSTAVAMFALSVRDAAPRYDVRPFVEAHWLEDGSFAATLLDEHGDVEYVFYGLLALGSI